MKDHGLQQIVVHAPYVVNLGNTVKPENYPLCRSISGEKRALAEAIGATQIVLHPGAHVGAGPEAASCTNCQGLKRNYWTGSKGQNRVLETMAGKGTEVELPSSNS